MCTANQIVYLLCDWYLLYGTHFKSLDNKSPVLCSSLFYLNPGFQEISIVCQPVLYSVKRPFGLASAENQFPMLFLEFIIFVWF